MLNKFILFCEPCAYKKIITEELAKNYEEIPRSTVPGGYPYIDKETKSVKEKKATEQPVMSKCPNCGRGVVLKRLPETYTKARKEQDKKEYEEKERLKKWQQENQ